MKKLRKERLPSWDLSQYYNSYEDPKIYEDLQKAKELVVQFQHKYLDKIADLAPIEILNSIQESEYINILLFKSTRYLSLMLKAGGKQADEIGKVFSKVEMIAAKIGSELFFWEAQMIQRPDLAQLIESQELDTYKNYLIRINESKKHRVLPEIERVLALKARTSCDSWADLFSSLNQLFTLVYDFGDGEYEYNLNNLANYYNDPSRKIRKEGMQLLFDGYKYNEVLYLEAINNIIQDQETDNEIYSFDSPEEATLMNDQVSQKYLDVLMNTIKENVEIYRNFLDIKKQMLRLKTIMDYDISAKVNLHNIPQKIYTWIECKHIILSALKDFDDEFYLIAKGFFDNKRIDAKHRKDKYSGSITSSFAPGFDPMILVYFEGKIQDIMILAHEIGHGIHTILSNQKQTYFNSEYSTVTAEMASLHCETIVFEYVIQTIDNPIERLNLLISKFDSDCYSLFTTGFGYYQFEKKMYNMHKQQGIILAKQARDFWRTEYLESVFGDTIKFTSGAEHGWQGVSHLSLVFYNYAYASGLLFAKHIYKEIHENPTKKHIYKEILGLGGSMTPAELMKKIDFDIEGREFWEEGFDIMKNNLKVIRKEWIQLKSLSSQKAHKLGIKKSGTTLTP